MPRLTDLLALSNVPRWSITPHVLPQTVADHSFRVMVIATELAGRLEIELSAQDLLNILSHDAHESWTADLPSPIKRKVEESGFDFGIVVPWRANAGFSGPNQKLCFELADKIEAHTFISVFGIGAQASRIANGCRDTVNKMLHHVNVPPGIPTSKWQSTARAVILEIIEERGRGWSYDQEG